MAVNALHSHFTSLNTVRCQLSLAHQRPTCWDVMQCGVTCRTQPQVHLQGMLKDRLKRSNQQNDVRRKLALLDALETRPFSGFRSTIFLTWQPGWLHL